MAVATVTPAVSARAAGRRTIGTSRQWCWYFEEHRYRLLRLPWEQGAALSDDERELIAESVRIFQQGEAQEGRHFFRCVRAHAEQSGDLDYIEAHRLFMEEEKRHGRDLARFLQLAEVPILERKSWLTWMFCWCGSRGGLESTLLVILMSEVLALVYYAALRRATRSPLLRRLCAQILRDEKRHVRFHCDRLVQLRQGRSALARGWAQALDRTLFLAAVTTCWAWHHRVFRAGGYSFERFWTAVHTIYQSIVFDKDPRNHIIPS